MDFQESEPAENTVDDPTSPAREIAAALLSVSVILSLALAWALRWG